MIECASFKRYYLFASIVIGLFILFTILLATGTLQPHIGTADVVKAYAPWYTNNDEGDYVITYS